MRKVRNSPESQRCTGERPGDDDVRSTRYTRGTCSDSTGNAAPWVTPELRATFCCARPP